MKGRAHASPEALTSAAHLPLVRSMPMPLPFLPHRYNHPPRRATWLLQLSRGMSSLTSRTVNILYPSTKTPAPPPTRPAEHSRRSRPHLNFEKAHTYASPPGDARTPLQQPPSAAACLLSRHSRPSSQSEACPRLHRDCCMPPRASRFAPFAPGGGMTSSTIELMFAFPPNLMRIRGYFYNLANAFSPPAVSVETHSQ